MFTFNGKKKWIIQKFLVKILLNIRLFVMLSWLLIILCALQSILSLFLSQYPVFRLVWVFFAESRRHWLNLCRKKECVGVFCFSCTLLASMQLVLTLQHPLQHIQLFNVISLHFCFLFLFKGFTGWSNFLLGNQH